MPGSENRSRKPSARRRTLLVLLVIFVFAVLLVSVAIAAGFVFLMNRFGLMQPITANRLPILLAFLLVVSLLVSIVITTIAGNLSLRPLKKFVDATREIAAGNFDVRVDTQGPYEYGRLATSFNEMAKELGSIETLREDFVSNISHEFKTPVTSINGFARLLKKGNLTEAEREEYLDIISAESARLTQLSSNVLLLSKLTSSDRLTDVMEYPLDEQLRRVVLLLDPQMEQKQMDLDVHLEPCAITSSPELLQQVWINLMTNAIRFTPPGGRISLTLSHSADAVEVAVGDTGIGMEPEVAAHAFDKFYQGDRSRTSQGNGLGLSLVKRIVELCSGRIDVWSRAGEGSVFTVTLPRHPSP